MYIIISLFIAYAVGIITYEYNIFNYSIIVIFVVLLINSIIKRKFLYNLVVIAFLLLSYINCYYNSISVLSQYVNQNLTLQVEIKSQNKSSSLNYNSFNASVLSINGVKLNSKENTIIYFNKNNNIDVNSIIEIEGKIADLEAGKNNLLFNYKNFLRSKKIYVTIFADDKIKLLESEYSAFIKISEGFRRFTENLFYGKLSKSNAEVILSIILGDVDYLDEDFYENIKAMGLAHIFAVSGSHIVLIYGCLINLFKWLCLKRQLSWLITWCLIWLYGFLIGFPLSVMRTLVMFTLLFGSEVIYRKYNSLNSIAVAALALTIYNPYWIFDAGFLLSFSAALSLIIYNKYIVKNIKIKNKLIKDIYMYIFLQIFTLPVITYYFNYLPIMGIVYNILLLPIFTFILIYSFILLICGSLFSFLLPFKLFNYFLYTLRFMINFTENFGFNGIEVRSFSIYEIIFFYLFIIFVIYLYNNINISLAKLGFSIYISFYIITLIAIPLFDTSLYFKLIDVGQGLFSTISYKNYNFVFDCGSTSNKNLGKYCVIPYFKKNGINNINGVFISHWDADHYSGIIELLGSNIEVKNIFSSEYSHLDIIDLNKKIIILKKDDSIYLDKSVKMNILWPEENFVGGRNNTSLVILINYNNRKLLLTGDIESNVEYMINNFEYSDIMVVPHHGSKTSSSDYLVNSVKPNYALLSYGRNSYGIPSMDVINKYVELDSVILSTYEQGEINFILNEDNIYYNTYTGMKSNNYYELYFIWIRMKLIIFYFLLTVILIFNKKENYELQNYYRFN